MAAALVVTAWVPAAKARSAAPQIDIAAGSLTEALSELSRKAGVSIGTEGALPHLKVRALHGRMSVAEALARLLSGSGLVARPVGASAWRIERQTVMEPPRAKPSPAAPPPETVGDDIVVTGTKRDYSLSDLPMAASVIRLDEQARMHTGSSTASVAGQIEGLALTGLGPGRNRMFLRGVADSAFSGESQSTVAVVFDDARLTYSAPDPDIRLVDIDRVEVLKGPQGSLYGSGALGGIYHIVSRKPDTGTASLAISSGSEIVAHGGIGYSASAVANLPLARDIAALRLVGYSAKEPGWINTGTRRDSNAGDVLGARAALGIEPGGDWRIDISGYAQWLKSHDSKYAYAPHQRERPAQLAEPHDNDLRHIALRVSRQGDGVDIVLSSAMTWHEVIDDLDASIGASEFGLANPRMLRDERAYRVWDNEARITGKAGGIDWLAGLSHVRARQTDTWTLSGANATSLVLDDDRRTAADTALFVDGALPVTDTLRLDLGARLFRSVLKEARQVGPNVVKRERKRSGITPSAALAWRPRAGRLLFVRYASAYRQGGSDITAAGQFETLKSDELATIEAGWREELSSGGKFDLGLYYSSWRNMQSDQLQADGLIETRNAGDARIIGGEVSLEHPLGPNWRIEAGANITMAKLVRNSLGFELKDRHLPAVPEYAVRAALQRDFRIGGSAALVRLQLRYSGPSRLSFDPAIDRPMGKVLESRVEMRAVLSGFDVTVAAENLLGGRSDAFAFGNSLRFATTRQYTPQKPPSLEVALLKRF